MYAHFALLIPEKNYHIIFRFSHLLSCLEIELVQVNFLGEGREVGPSRGQHGSGVVSGGESEF